MADFYPAPLDDADLEDANPYQNPKLREAWARGWREWEADDSAPNPHRNDALRRAWNRGARAAQRYLFGD